MATACQKREHRLGYFPRWMVRGSLSFVCSTRGKGGGRRGIHLYVCLFSRGAERRMRDLFCFVGGIWRGGVGWGDWRGIVIEKKRWVEQVCEAG